MFTENHYVPILKWRQGEYQALFRLSDPIKKFVTPLFEIPTEAWDFEKEEAAKSIDDHLEKFGDRLKAKWGSKSCFIDSCYLDGNAVVSSGRHHLAHIFDLARTAGAKPIPVFGLTRHSSYITAVKAIAKADGRGACLRLVTDDFGDDLVPNIATLLKRIVVSESDCDLVIDSAESISQSKETTALIWQALLQQIPHIALWRSVTIAGTAFPNALPANTFRPNGAILRFEWTSYKALIKKLPSGSRIPTFGDYAAAHPRTELMDPRMLDPNAKIKYAIDDRWYIVLGLQVKRNGREQYRGLCKAIISAAPPIFSGAGYSWADDYIIGCAAGTESTGGTSTWPSVAANRHITKVVRDVASLFGSSTPP